MSRKLFDDDGNEYDIPSEEELSELHTKAEKADKVTEYEKIVSDIREALDLKEDDDIAGAVKLAKESANPNWKEARQKMEKLTAWAKANGGKVDEKTGEVNKEEQLDPVKIADEARKAAKEEIYNQQLSQKLSRYPEDKREVVKAYFEKLSAGEEINSEVIEKYIPQAESLSFPKGTPTPSIDGSAPDFDINNRDDFSRTEQGQQVAKDMNLPFANEEKGNK